MTKHICMRNSRPALEVLSELPNKGAFAIAIMALSILVISCGGSDPTGPPDPNARMYGTWSGTMNLVFTTGDLSQDPVTLKITKSGATFFISGAQYPTNRDKLSEDFIGFHFTAFGFRFQCLGTRVGNVIQGSVVAPQAASGEFAVTRE